MGVRVRSGLGRVGGELFGRLSDEEVIGGINGFDVQVVCPENRVLSDREGGVRFFSARVRTIEKIRGFSESYTLGLFLPAKERREIDGLLPDKCGSHHPEAFAYVNGYVKGMPGYGCNALVVTDNECQTYSRLLQRKKETKDFDSEKTDELLRKYSDWSKMGLLGIQFLARQVQSEYVFHIDKETQEKRIHRLFGLKLPEKLGEILYHQIPTKMGYKPWERYIEGDEKPVTFHLMGTTMDGGYYKKVLPPTAIAI